MAIHFLPACAVAISMHYSVPHELIHAVRMAEGGAIGQSVCKNRDGSCDNGPMQINDGWFDGSFGIDLRRYGITKERALESECQNIAIGAWVLRMNYDRLQDWRQAVSAYNTGMKNRNGKIGKAYADRVFRWKDRLAKRAGTSEQASIEEPLKPIMVWAQPGA